jgi:type I restriction enzyme S subunit
MNTPPGRERVEVFCQTTAGNIGISAGNLATIMIPAPSIPDQERLVAALDCLGDRTASLRSLQSQTTAELDALTPAILDRAFKGEL